MIRHLLQIFFTLGLTFMVDLLRRSRPDRPARRRC